MNNSWHPDCFRCDICLAVLADVGFVKNAGRYILRLSTVYITLSEYTAGSYKVSSWCLNDLLSIII